MFGRRRPRRPATSSADGLGIGALVRVLPGSEWADEPIGVVVAPGGNQGVGVPGVGQAVSWTVEFDEPARTTDGRGPFGRATVSSRLLEPLPRDVDPGE